MLRGAPRVIPNSEEFTHVAHGTVVSHYRPDCWGAWNLGRRVRVGEDRVDPVRDFSDPCADLVCLRGLAHAAAGLSFGEAPFSAALDWTGALPHPYMCAAFSIRFLIALPFPKHTWRGVGICKRGACAFDRAGREPLRILVKRTKPRTAHKDVPMRFHALACDYDGTLAHDSCVDLITLAALDRFRATGRKLILVTGRELHELLQAYPEADRCDWIVAENGALLYRPATREEKLLGPALPESFVQRVRAGGVTPLSIGRVILATRQPHESSLLGLIRELGLELHVVFNKGAVMVLPAGVNKATGLSAALKLAGLSPHEVVGVGDAENDHAFLSMCECAVAVANALPAIKDHADLITNGDHGAGVVELIDDIIRTDLSRSENRLTRHHLVLGHDLQNHSVHLPPYAPNVLIAGPSGSGKSSAAASLLDRLSEKKYQFCIIDPEGDYQSLAGAVTLGDSERGAGIAEVLQVLGDENQNVVVNLVGLPIADRPPFFLGLLARLQEMRVRCGRPHWLVVDEAHHLLPPSWEPGALALSQELNRTLFITVHPDQISPAVLASVGIIIAVGAKPAETIGQFCRAGHIPVPQMRTTSLEAGEVMIWGHTTEQGPVLVRITPSKVERRRHTRKYAEGELPAERSFFFRGPDGKLNLRAQNFVLFLQMADGIDDETWLHHLHQHDYSRWIRERIKDDALAAEVEGVERQWNIDAAKSRTMIREAIERHYTLPAAAASPGEPPARPES